MKIYLDTETVGLNGPVKTVQYSVDRGPIKIIRLFRGWRGDSAKVHEVGAFLRLLTDPANTMVGFNLTFDLYHLYRLAHVLGGHDLASPERPEPAFKAATLDLYTHAVQHGPFAPWAYGNRNKRVACVRKIPVVARAAITKAVEEKLRETLPAGVELVPHEHEVKGRKDLVTLSWTVAASLSLKAHAASYGLSVQHIKDVWPLVPRELEKPWLPYPHDPAVYDPAEARCDAILADESHPMTRYMEDDIRFLWAVEDGLSQPAPSHHDANVAMVAYTRYYGFPLDQGELLKGQDDLHAKLARIEAQIAGVNLKSSKQRLEALQKHEPWVKSSKKEVLQQLAKEQTECGRLAKAMLSYGPTKQRLDQIEKLLESRTGRAHPSFRVMGTTTYRMSGSDGFNFQGIAADSPTRKSFGTVYGGDFASFEVAIAASAWADCQLRADLTSGVDVHTATMVACHPDIVGKFTYEEALAAYNDHEHPDHALVKKARTHTKRIVFGVFYGAGAFKVAQVLGVSAEEAQLVIDRMFGRYAGVGAFRKREEERFLTADLESWRPDSVARMARSAVDLVGHERRFDFECDVANALWTLGQRGVRTGCEGMVVRNIEKGPQTIDNAVRSALLGGAMAIQQSVYRAAVNMPIQSTGANLCKMLAAEIWERLRCPMMNVHDELQFPAHVRFHEDVVEQIVGSFVERYRGKVEHIRFDGKGTERWSDK